MSSFEENARIPAKALAWVRDIAHLFSAITGLVICYSVAWRLLGVHLPAAPHVLGITFTYLPQIACSVVALIMIAFLDGGIRKLLPYALDEILDNRMFQEQGRRRWLRVVFAVFILAMTSLMAFGSGFVSWGSRETVAELATADIHTADVVAIDAAEAQRRENVELDYNKRITRAEETASERISAAQQAVREAERNYERSNSRLSKLAAAGNGWAQRKLSQGRSAASAAARRALESERNRTTLLQEAKTAALAETQSAAQSRISTMQSENAKLEAKKARKEALVGGVAGWFALGSLAIAILAHVLLSFHRILAGLGTYEKLRGGFSFALPGVGLIRRFREEYQTANERYTASQPTASAPIGFQQKGTESGNFSGKPTGKVAGGRGESPVMQHQNNTGKSYRPRKDVRKRNDAIRTAWDGLSDQLGRTPTVSEVQEIVTFGEKTIRKAINEMGLRG